ncbi:MAG: AMP-binding protein, partial [Candidatus Latescibacteria bacterium]|nr:AMP-binding protein [Candidatus Latescibacterota bacterium]
MTQRKPAAKKKTPAKASAKSSAQPEIISVLQEERVFTPSEEFSQNAHVKSFAEYEALYREAEEDLEAFWARQARENLSWFKEWDQVLDWKPPFAKWFVGGEINISHNCLDRHLTTWRRNKAALIWEGELGDQRTLTYQQLHREVCRFANVLKKLGVRTGDRVALYMPMVPELAIAMLSCARLGAVHTVIFGGFSAESVRDRVNDAQARLIVTADGGWRRGNIVPLKEAVDDAIEGGTPSVAQIVVVKRTAHDVHMEPGRDHWWHEMMETVGDECEAERLDSEHPLYILYTSGTTGKPKGVVHTTAGYLLQAALTCKWVFDLKDEDVYW